MKKMNKNKKIIIGILSAFIIVIGIVVAYKLIEKSVTNRENFKYTVDNISSTPVVTVNNERNKETVEWNEVTKDGVDEELLLKNVDTELLTQIARELQTLVGEELEDERENPEIVITEGFPRVFKSERYKKVLNMGTSAMKPLYLILYKSPNAGMYEYICANALYELSGYDFEWENSKEFLEKFNEKVLTEGNV